MPHINLFSYEELERRSREEGKPIEQIIVESFQNSSPDTTPPSTLLESPIENPQ